MTKEIKISKEEAELVFIDLYSSLMRDTQHEALGSLREPGIEKNLQNENYLFV